ncbi:hypothetical protein QYF36_022655 [Acer negundo]|nr:hypothetical protein QYF36_022655 [Acer negundo]
MPRPSKKKKDKGASSSGSSVGVRNLNFHVRLENNLGRAILSERNIDLNNLLRSEVPQMVDAMGWRQLVTTTYRINERLVREFYAAMVHTEFDKGTPVKVRGVDVQCPRHQQLLWYPELWRFRYRSSQSCYLQEEKLDVGRQAISQAGKVDNLVMSFPALITYFLGCAVEEAEDDAEEAPGAVPVGDRRPVWVDELFRRQGEMETEQTALEKAMTDLTKAIQDSYLSASER